VTDRLQRAVDALDRRRARRSKLEPDRVVLAPRHADDAELRFCGKCWYRVNELAEFEAFKKRARCSEPWMIRITLPWSCYGHDYKHGHIQHHWRGVRVCPKCGGALESVTL
jgi:ribosomal protein S27AE